VRSEARLDKLILSSTDIVPFCLFHKHGKSGWPMKKGTGIGIGIAVAVVVIILGITSLPDKILIDSPSIDTSEGQTSEEKKVVVPSESIISTEQTEPEELPVEPIEQTEPEESQGNVIEVKIRDGVGSKDR